MGFLDHLVLQIIQGVPAIPTDVFCIENPLQILNLMDVNAGVSLKQDGWSPAVPSLEGSGVWADSPLSTGRRPLVMQESNVTETMNLIVSASSFLAVTKILANINTMAINARAFWTDNVQYDPVYLKWWASCGKGPQYALIYNMDLKYEYGDSPTPMIEATLSIEREPYWRALPPGANPKQWAFELNNQPWNTSATNLGSASTTDRFLSGTVQNKSEFGTVNFDTLISSNCVVIPASVIPGDAPALMNLYWNPLATNYNFIMGKKTNKLTQYISSTLTIAQNATFNMNDGTLGTDATSVNDVGGVRAAAAALASRVEVSFATATNQLRWRLVTNIGSTNRFIGRWMVFLRCRQQGGTLGDITMYLRYGLKVSSDTEGVKLNSVYPPVIAGAGATTEWGLVYMGIVTLPVTNTKADVNQGIIGAGTSAGLNSLGIGDFQLGLFALRSAGVAPLYLCDIMLVPIDEGSISQEIPSTPGTSGGVWYDETGYFTHGTPDQYCVNGLPALSGVIPMKVSGPGIQLTPGIENRLYFILYDDTNQSAVADTTNFHINIIPRWRGIRDV